MRNHLAIAFVLTLMLHATGAAAQPAPRTLPLERVRLYETGVGYFERAGVIGAQSGSVSLPVPAGHLDDALKTMVVLSGDDDARVSGIEFSSSASRPLALALAGLPSEAGEPLSQRRLLSSLKGAPVELRTEGGTVTGRLIEVVGGEEEGTKNCHAATQRLATANGGVSDTALAEWIAQCAAAHASTLLLLSDRGEIRRFSSQELRSVRPTDPAFRSRLAAALDALGQRGSQTRRSLHLQATAGKPVTLGYVAEAPIWRSTYRLVLATDSDRATLQGWALLHNDTDEDWRSVRVELCNGQPDSFLFPLAAPRYARRELVTPRRPLSTVPQLLDTTVDNMWVGDSFGAGGLGLTGIGHGGGGGRGEGVGLGRIGTVGYGAGDTASGLLAVGDLAAVQDADGVEAGALFRYALPAAVDLRAHGSALMPFLSRPVGATRIALFAKPGATARSAVHLTNETGQTLPAGTIALFSDGGFAGESALSRTKPAESRIVSYGVDLDVELEQQQVRQSEEPRLFVADGDALTEHFVRHHEITHQIVNRSAAPRTVYLQLGFVHNSQISGAEETAFDSEQNAAFAVFRSAPRSRGTRTLKVTEGLQRSRPIKELTIKELERLADTTSLPAQQRTTLRATAKLLRQTVRSERRQAKTNHRLAELAGEMRRLRENIEALGSGSDAAEPFVERLVAAADRARSLRRQAAQWKRKANDARQTAHRRLRTLKPPDGSSPRG